MRSIAPVAASLPPIAPLTPSAAIALEAMYQPRRPRFSADSKLLAAGGFLAATMLVVAFGVWRASEPPPAASSVAFPVVVEAHPASHAAASHAPPPVTMLPVATSPAPLSGGASVTLDLDHGPTVDVQSLPRASRPKPRAWVAPPPHSALVAPSSAGWIAANPVQPKAAPAASAKADTAATDDDTSADTAATAEAVAPAPAPAPEPTTTASAAAPVATVDSFVQAVRDDIREDESHGRK